MFLKTFPTTLCANDSLTKDHPFLKTTFVGFVGQSLERESTLYVEL